MASYEIKQTKKKKETQDKKEGHSVHLLTKSELK
jgi:hypothetical protein